MTDQLEEFLELFRDEARGRLDNMVDCLLALERGEDPGEPIGNLFREAHTIKGAAGMLGLGDVHDLAHVLEDILSDVRDANHFPIHLAMPLLRSVDMLRAQIAGEHHPPAELIAELVALRAGREPVSVTAPVAPAAASEPPTGMLFPEPVVGIAPLSTIAPSTQRRSVHVTAEKIDRLLDLVGETALHRSRLKYVLAQDEEKRPAIVDELDIGDRLLDELKETAISMRTVPLGSIVGSFPRAVRDLALAAGKDVDLDLIGTETELDRVIVESLPDTLTHLLRNAVAHGIEAPEERERSHKRRRGVITLRAEQRGSEVEITVSDDGRGVTEELLEEAREVGSLTEVVTRRGYSTAEMVTELAGRGVGLDAVRTRVEGFGGRLEVRSTPGNGMAVTLVLPLALALLEVLLVERGEGVFGIPLSAVDEVLSVRGEMVLEGAPALDIHGSSVPLLDLADVVGAAAPLLEERGPAAVVSVGERRAVLACDRLIGQEEIVVKPIGLLGGVRGYVGGAILGDGRIALLLDLSSVFHKHRRPSPPSADEHVAPVVAPKILVVEDFLTVRELQRSILETAGYRVVTAENGRDALDRLASDPEIALVLTDIEMPVMDGFALTSAIRSIPERQSLPVVIVTTRDSENDRQRGLIVGADAYMAKRRFDQQSLLETVERLIGR